MCKNVYLCREIGCKMKIARFIILLTIILCHLSIQKVYATTTTSVQLRQMADKKYYGEDFPEALAIYIKAMEAATAEGNDSNYIACTGYIGNIYNTLETTKVVWFIILKAIELPSALEVYTCKQVFLEISLFVIHKWVM